MLVQRGSLIMRRVVVKPEVGQLRYDSFNGVVEVVAVDGRHVTFMLTGKKLTRTINDFTKRFHSVKETK